MTKVEREAKTDANKLSHAIRIDKERGSNFTKRELQRQGKKVEVKK